MLLSATDARADGCKAGEESPAITDAEEEPDGKCKLRTEDSESNEKARAPLIVLLEPLKRQATKEQEQDAVLANDDGEKDRKKREEGERARMPRKRKGRVTWAGDVGEAEEDAIDCDGGQVGRAVAQQGERNEEKCLKRGMIEGFDAKGRCNKMILDRPLKAQIVEVGERGPGEIPGGVKGAKVVMAGNPADERDA